MLAPIFRCHCFLQTSHKDPESCKPFDENAQWLFFTLLGYCLLHFRFATDCNFYWTLSHSTTFPKAPVLTALHSPPTSLCSTPARLWSLKTRMFVLFFIFQACPLIWNYVSLFLFHLQIDFLRHVATCLHRCPSRDPRHHQVECIMLNLFLFLWVALLCQC